jgi:hypothetical protein
MCGILSFSALCLLIWGFSRPGTSVLPSRFTLWPLPCRRSSRNWGTRTRTRTCSVSRPIFLGSSPRYWLLLCPMIGCSNEVFYQWRDTRCHCWTPHQCIKWGQVLYVSSPGCSIPGPVFIGISVPFLDCLGGCRPCITTAITFIGNKFVRCLLCRLL